MNPQTDNTVNPLLLADIVLSEDVLKVIQRKIVITTGNHIPLPQLRQDLLHYVIRNHKP